MERKSFLLLLKLNWPNTFVKIIVIKLLRHNKLGREGKGTGYQKATKRQFQTSDQIEIRAFKLRTANYTVQTVE